MNAEHLFEQGELYTGQHSDARGLTIYIGDGREMGFNFSLRSMLRGSSILNLSDAGLGLKGVRPLNRELHGVQAEETTFPCSIATLVMRGVIIRTRMKASPGGGYRK